ncbi:phosphoadenylyl-sulfate reductase [Paracoccus sp. S-4012]|uniref:phosphoadenylyl-sulfate reductase n=1 Tax=Paracoccus sp. S-4012 TaxID=2665648 RepID=UPI0012B0D6E5|nr:phosphoadenylyl-sulfate reductase [Paracoccus sp. S-4012]MRX51143.1 phosphoadenylyl-sulfate reductase [Paracoccus sp. S-4012]
MPHDRVEALNARTRGFSPRAVLEQALGETGRTALVSSFGAEAVVLLHLAATLDPGLPVIFIDTEMLFPETYAYQHDLAERLGLTDLRLIRPDAAALAARDPDGSLHRRDTDGCCDLRKTLPLAQALHGFDAWITGRKRFHGAERTGLEHFEVEPTGRIKVNPLAHVRREGIAAYMDAHDLPRHPLVARGYASIGCTPCTTRTAPGEDARAGRWRGSDKTECGVHLIGRKPAPAPAQQEDAA